MPGKFDIHVLFNHWDRFAEGFFHTIEASVLALIGSFVLGVIIAVMRISPIRALNVIGTVYVEFIRNIPLLLVVFFFFLGIPSLGLPLDGFTSGTLGLMVYTASFIAEAIRAGIQSVPAGQTEAARATGLSYIQTMLHIVLPQAIKIVLPAIGNQFINLVKNSGFILARGEDAAMDFIGAYSLPNVKFLLEGFLVTIEVAVLSIVFSFVLGTVLGTLRYAKIPVLSRIVAAIVDIIRNLPLLLIIFFMYIVLPQLGIKMSPFWATVVGLTLFEGAMISEIVRGGLNSVDRGQIEAARSSGLIYMQTLRHIILPQALRRMVPPLVSQFISLLKDTSLAVIISLPELMHNVQILQGHSPNYVIPALIFAAALYFIVNYILSIIARRLEAKTL
ncbi:hypothetical protein BGX30_009685 [Mortierella sp. GBA39]|nr:hypothetical protein BGX30_009685 [Mortierella sp. GBA39]